MANTPNTATVQDFLDAAWNQGDTSVIDRTVAEDHVEHEPDGDQIGRGHLKETVLAYRTAFPDLRMSLEDQIADGDRVATRWTATGTHLGELNGISATGRTAHVSGIFIHRLADGQINESWSMFDQIRLLLQLGAIHLPAPEETST
jgi:steroid delta-isomerase-like uncharacterized protein